jgi:hypothetical protein
MRITFFKTGRPKQFNYMPRYYDEQKEEREERQRRIEQELGMKEKEGVYKSRLKHGVMSERMMARKKSNQYSTIRLLIIIAILTILVLYLLRDFEAFNSLFN